MCTVVVLIRPAHAWPLVLAANRDEMLERSWDPPAAHWPDQPDVVAGRDRSGGGTWMGINRAGVVAAVLNRPGSLGPAAGKRSRGDLPLRALAHPDADAAAAAITILDAGQWRSFNLVLADRAGAIFVRGLGHGRPQAERLALGLHMVTAHDPDDLDSPRVARHLPRFRAARPPEPGNWRDWQALLADQSGEAGEQLNVQPRGGFGTVCSSLLALPAAAAPVWLFAAGPPHQTPFAPAC
ncbi:MAG TPA: NRDE family protein [Acetobacteraceae bacterium]|nr:NRDE family protein [Acetobacteraceae bacterium]